MSGSLFSLEFTASNQWKQKTLLSFFLTFRPNGFFRNDFVSLATQTSLTQAIVILISLCQQPWRQSPRRVETVSSL